MNKALSELYKLKWRKLIDESKGKNSACPLLIKVKGNYECADLRIMIVGQETDCWAGKFEDNVLTIEQLQDKYFKYFYDDSKKFRRPFWNRKNFRYFQEELVKKYPSIKIEFVWNNANKIGNNGRGEPTDAIKSMEKNYFDVFEEELKILNPNVVLFVTGHRALPVKNQDANIGLKGINKLDLSNFPNILALRTYHPNARIKGGKKILKIKMFELICEHIESLNFAMP